MTKDLVQTGISPVFWCNPRVTRPCSTATRHKARDDFERAKVPSFVSTEANGQVCWFDRLLEGGIFLQGAKPKLRNDTETAQSEPPVSILLAGPPGGGKSTFATELSYRLATLDYVTLYISTESTAGQIHDNAKRFGWPEVEKFIPDPRKQHLKNLDQRHPFGRVLVSGTDTIVENGNLAGIIDTALQGAFAAFTGVDFTKGDPWIRRLFEYSDTKKMVGRINPDIVVVDSLNVLETDATVASFSRFLDKLGTGKGRPSLVLLVLDSVDTPHSFHRCWEYKCDNIIRLDYEYSSGYFQRTIQIVKARFQPHVWGKHLFKIYPPFEFDELVLNDNSFEDEDQRKITRRKYPYRMEGGIYIFPAIDHFLSLYKRRGPTKPPATVPTPIPSLNAVLGGNILKDAGLPEGRCTAIIGGRGGHKSQFAYLHLLSRILPELRRRIAERCVPSRDLLQITNEPDERGLIVSLRDDEGMTEQALDKIVKQHHLNDNVRSLEEQDRLEVLYFPPGNITPEEFLHRMYVSIQRLKQTGKKLTVLFNSLDQLASRFPLCANETLFIPAIIEVLLGEEITSIFVAVKSEGQPADQYGLLPLADVILSTRLRRSVPFEEYFETVTRCWEGIDGILKTESELEQILGESKGTKVGTVELEVTRFAGGKRAGERGYWEALEDSNFDDSLFAHAGIHFTPCNLKMMDYIKKDPDLAIASQLR